PPARGPARRDRGERLPGRRAGRRVRGHAPGPPLTADIEQVLVHERPPAHCWSVLPLVSLLLVPGAVRVTWPGWPGREAVPRSAARAEPSEFVKLVWRHPEGRP